MLDARSLRRMSLVCRLSYRSHRPSLPVRRGELINIVAHFDSDSWTEESWTRECDVSELTTTYAGWHPHLLRLYGCSARWYNGRSTIAIRSSDGAKGG